MARLIFYLPDEEYQVLLNLSEREFRDPRAQAALIIRRELESQGLIAPANTPPVITPPAQEPSAQGAADQITTDEMEK